MNIMRIRYEKAGRHIHCRVFTATAPHHTFANCGTLVFDEDEWPNIREMFRNAEFIGEERPCKP